MALQVNQIFLNLPVSDLNRSREFFSQLGFGFNEQFSDEHAACMVLNEQSFVMLLVTDFFKRFTPKEIADAKGQTEMIMSFSAGSREQVDGLVEKALQAGGQKANEPLDEGGMYARSFFDPDGHLWEVMYMDMEESQGG